jgi:VanZ family protein
VWAAVIFYLSTLTGEQVVHALPFKVWDKFLHAIAFAAGAVPLTLALRLSKSWPWRRIALVSILLVSAYGASDEWHQQFTPGRSAKDVGDWTADTVGAVIGTLTAAWIYARYSTPPRLAPARA